MRRLGSRRTGAGIWLICQWSMRRCTGGTRYTSLVVHNCYATLTIRLRNGMWVGKLSGP